MFGSIYLTYILFSFETSFYFHSPTQFYSHSPWSQMILWLDKSKIFGAREREWVGLSQQARAGKPTEKRRYACGHGVQKEKDKRCKIFKNGKLGAVGDRPPVLLCTGDRKLEIPSRTRSYLQLPSHFFLC